MAYNQQFKPTSSEEWRAKEKREMFGKAVNSLLMTNKDLELEIALDKAKEIVNFAFKNFPPPEDAKPSEEGDFGELPLRTIKND